MVHGEVSRFGEDLTSRQTDSRARLAAGAGADASAVPTEPPKDSTPYPGLGLSCLSGRLSGRQCLSHSHRALPLLPLGFGWVPRLARPLAVV